MTSQPPAQAETPSRRTRLPVIPDLRFEQSYLRSVAPYVHLSRGESSKETLKEELRLEDDGEWKVVEGRGDGFEDIKGKEMETLSGPPEIHIEWRHVALVTMRDQVFSPLLQGVLWGVASHFLRPLSSLLGFHIRKFFTSHLPSPGEGLGVGWLRSWVRNMGLGMTTR